MVRGMKKEKELTIEERLEKALVPVEEQPYSVPKNWCWTSLKYVANLLNGDRGINYPSKKDYQDMGIPFINAGAIVNGELCEFAFNYISEEKYNALRAGKIEEGDILYCLRGSLGKTAIVKTNQKGAISSSLCIIRKKNIIYNKYLYHFLCSYIIKKQQDSVENGSAQPNLSAANVMDYLVPIATISEQQRIVDRIESLFAKLDEAKEKAQAVIDGFETRKSAILHKAFTGELTEKWRQEQGVGLNSWENVELSRRFEIVGGVQKKPSRSPKDNPIPYLTVANVFRDRIDLSEIRYFEVFDGELDKLKLQEKDILVVEGNGSGNEIGRCAMWRSELPVCIHQNHIIRLRATNSDTIPEYVLYFLNSSMGKSIMKECAKTTTGLFNLSTGKIRTISVPFATASEQAEIVYILDGLFDKEQQARQAAEAVLDKIETMKKSILARAFRGELGTNDPTEESSVELLKNTLI